MDASTSAPQPQRASRAAGRGRLAWFGLGFLWLLVLGLVLSGARLAYYSNTRFSEKLERVRGLQEAFKEASVLMGLVVELENGQRDYLLTQQRAALQAYRDAVAQLPDQVARLQAMLATREEFRDELQRLVSIAAQEQQGLARLQRVAEKRGRAQALAQARSATGAPEMDRTREAVVGLQMHLVEVAINEQSALHAVIARRNLAIYLTILLGALAALGALLLLRRQYLTLHEEQLLRARMLESQRESLQKSSFVATMSHEIRTPMNAILGFSQLLLERVGDSVSRRYVEAITVSGRSLLALIDDILDLSKVESGMLEIRALPTSLREVADGVVAVFSQQAADKRLKLAAEVDSAVPDSVLLDAARLRQMLFNLVGNAVKYTDRGSVLLRVGARANPDDPQLLSCVFEVQDSGMGIAPDELERIFEPFVQAEAGRTLPREGTGLGLSITRQLAQRMGGSLEVESQVGQGSTFRIVLPKVAAATTLPLPAIEAGEVEELPPMRILVVDDVDWNRELLVAMFRDTPHTVLTAASGAEALALARSQHPQLMLIDIRMPGMDGFEVQRRLRAEPELADIRLIAVTATSMRNEQARLRQLFDGYVAKPFTRDSLFAEVQRVMRSAPAGGPAVAKLPDSVRRRLQRLLTRDWPAVRAAPAMRDVKNFAQALDELAIAARHEALRRYARELNDAAFAFDALRVEALLEDLPARGGELLTLNKGNA